MLKGKCVVFANLKEKKLGGVPSHGMVMCADNTDHTKLEIIRPPEDAVIGERVYL
jgi:aminoacyl tRNA synthase complex-interacting multifunctional protein 1